MILLVLTSLQIPKEPELGTYSMPKLPFMMLLVQNSCNLGISNFQLEEKAEGIYFAHHHQNSYHQQTDSLSHHSSPKIRNVKVILNFDDI